MKLLKEVQKKKKEEKSLFFFHFSLSIRSESTDISITRATTRSKLEHYGFNQLARPTSIRNNKRQTSIKENKNKRIRSDDIILQQ